MSMFATTPVRAEQVWTPGSRLFVVPPDGQGIFSGTLREHLSFLSLEEGRVRAGPVLDVEMRHSLPGIAEKRFFAEVCWYDQGTRCFTTFEAARKYWQDVFGCRRTLTE